MANFGTLRAASLQASYFIASNGKRVINDGRKWRKRPADCTLKQNGLKLAVSLRPRISSFSPCFVLATIIRVTRPVTINHGDRASSLCHAESLQVLQKWLRIGDNAVTFWESDGFAAAQTLAKGLQISRAMLQRPCHTVCASLKTTGHSRGQASLNFQFEIPFSSAAEYGKREVWSLTFWNV